MARSCLWRLCSTTSKIWLSTARIHGWFFHLPRSIKHRNIISAFDYFETSVSSILAATSDLLPRASKRHQPALIWASRRATFPRFWSISMAAHWRRALQTCGSWMNSWLAPGRILGRMLCEKLLLGISRSSPPGNCSACCFQPCAPWPRADGYKSE